ncbi:adenosylcobinamide-GDP ribazoletransferase [Pyrococcus furiosus DSM 3638]|uniref:Adenosylcobinamide-GDP ribazoletransferase n=3 Tax=Pyrococcus furiosus TaxID=2261 RepID=COBS_PYRFU|nr:adenosylcobinamide-GDP ribazoletransferase [Pyrococcus furiosus]Q8U400.1 RecName: Full=Adenosylcobinamide-GDP ribazoletransferase; AltName: Full=Cobalamin synthase; AltName: Full=Cobalamin-5'-phosphate synthase [Pyrococcus furiosus DSM 3638]AAL80423.1 cobalamin (5'-phosphate) synthase [Pyrococcus furiosus DSM 3638]QEK78017.1 adenosylcobinamide-GDP ribazoletransferase [Pyrococcus furiosus DSM 3638]
MKNLIQFMTRVPIKGDFEKAREEVWMLPLLTPLTAFIPSLILYLNIPLKNVLSILSLYWVIGLLHLDGLADWADGIMVKGDREKKVRAMKDVNTGIAGTFAVVMILLIQVYSLFSAPFYSIYLAELNSKMAMLLALATKKPLGEGLGKYFMDKLTTKRVFLGGVLYALLLIPILLYDPQSIFALLGLVGGIYAVKISLDNFGGLNGDCIGAVGEITRGATLLILGVWA